MVKDIGIYYGGIAFYTSLVHNVFLLYHVQIFVSIYKIQKYSFWIAEIVFLFWNSINDPLFGWISDKGLLNARKDVDVVDKRLTALQKAVPLLAASFLLFWFEWPIWTGLQLMLCLCAYDSFLTVIDLQHNSLLADLEVSSEKRTKLNSYSAIGSAVGSISVFLSHIFWSDLNSFRIFCFFIALVSCIGSSWCVREFRRIRLTRKNLSEEYEKKKNPSAIVFAKQLFKQKNFNLFSALNLLQVFHCHFNSNFFPLFLYHLLGDNVSPSTASFILGFSFVAPHVNNLYFLIACRKYGTYYVINNLLWIKVIFALLMFFFVGPNGSYVIIGIFIATNRMFTEGTCKLLGLIISDLVDEDAVVQNRKQPVSALVFGTAALLAKPGQTLAPLIGLSLLGILTGNDIFSQVDNHSLKLDATLLPQALHDVFKDAAFKILVLVPIICGGAQLLLWKNFNLHTSRLKWIKSMRHNSAYTVV